MNAGTFKRVYVLVLAIVLSGGMLLSAGAIPAYGASNSSTFTTKMKFYDKVKASYEYNYTNGDVWTSSADIPIGGASNGNGTKFSQVYCIDPFVPYHSLADSTTWAGPTAKDYEGNTWGATTTDTKGSYVTVAPWEMSGEMQKNAELVSWLVLNGYRGDFRNESGDESESKASVKRLNDLYATEVGGAIDKTTALMATKISIWKAVTDDGNGNSIQVTDTSLDGIPGARSKLDKLVAALVRDAKADRPVGGVAPASHLDLHIDNTHIDVLNHHDGYYYYGPLTVTADGDGASKVSEAFLTASGFDTKSAGVEFVTTTGPVDIGTPLDSGDLYGTNQSAQYIEGHPSADTWTSDPFYLRVPDTRALQLDQLSIKAMSKAPDITVTQGTPVFLVNEEDGIQDWNAVQAFAGAAEQDTTVDLYAEDSVRTNNEVNLGQLYIQKQVENDTPIASDENQAFTFKVYYQYHSANTQEDIDFSHATELNLTDHPVNGAVSVDPDNNTFTLKNGGLALIDNLPMDDYYYWVVEVGPLTAGFTSRSYAIPLAAEPKARGADTHLSANSDGIAGPFQLDEDNEIGMVTFYNTKDANKAYLQVAKYAMDIDGDGYSPGGALGKEFNFKLECSKDGGATWAAYPLSDANFVSKGGSSADGGGSLVNGENGEFTLHTLEQAFIEVEPGGNPSYLYRVLELDPDVGWWTSLGITIQEVGKTVRTIPEAAKDAPLWVGPGNRVSDAITAEEGGNYLFTYANYGGNSYDLNISKTVAGDAATDADRNQLFPFTLSHKIPADPQTEAPEMSEPVMLSAKGGWVTLPGLGEYLSWKVDIKGADGKMLSPEAVAARIKSQNLDMSWYNEDWGTVAMPVVLELKHGEVATINDLFAGQYEVREIRSEKDADRYITTYACAKDGAVIKGAGDTVELPFDGAEQIDFTNTVKPNEPNIPNEPNTPGAKVPNTGDSRALPISQIIVLSLVAGAALMLVQSRRRRRINE